MIKMGMPVHNFSVEQIKEQIKENAEAFKNSAPTSSEQAAEIILSAVKNKQWRILVGDDAKAIDEWVRNDPENAYNITFRGEKRGE
jgi:vacuolar-type H+-ATPase subunit E/Vma4